MVVRDEFLSAPRLSIPDAAPSPRDGRTIMFRDGEGREHRPIVDFKFLKDVVEGAL